MTCHWPMGEAAGVSHACQGRLTDSRDCGKVNAEHRACVCVMTPVRVPIEGLRSALVFTCSDSVGNKLRRI